MIPSRRRILSLGLATACCFRPATLLADTFPGRPLRWLVGFPPGGGATIATRVISDWLSRRLDQPILVENRPGASGNLALQEGAKAAADGHTLLLVPASAVVNRALTAKPPVDVLSDIEPVSGLVDFALVLLASPTLRAQRVDELVSYASLHPGELNLASFGVGSTSHLAGELFQIMTGTRLTHIPYPGEAAALTDLIGGRVHLMFGVLSTSLTHIEAGSVRALAVATQDRHPLLPALPAVRETVPGFEASSWLGVGVPKGTARDVVALLNHEINAGLTDTEVRARYTKMAATPLVLSPADFGQHMVREAAKWAEVARRVGLAPK
jgi:tripartite-type tricarboxylate transporter receptor subunit TctC